MNGWADRVLHTARYAANKKLFGSQKEAGITDVVTLLTNNQNIKVYQESGFGTHRVPISSEVEETERRCLYDKLRELLSNPDSRVLVHGDVIDENVAGLMSGFLVATGLVPDPGQRSNHHRADSGTPPWRPGTFSDPRLPRRRVKGPLSLAVIGPGRAGGSLAIAAQWAGHRVETVPGPSRIRPTAVANHPSKKRGPFVCLRSVADSNSR